MRAVLSRVKAKLLDPALEDPGVLTRPQVWRVVDAAREQEFVGLQSRVLDPLLYGFTGDWRDLELNGSLSFVLHHDGPRGHLVAVAYVADLECNEVTSSELAVDTQVEERELAYSVVSGHLTAHLRRWWSADQRPASAMRQGSKAS